MPLTTRGGKLLWDWAFRAAARPSNFYAALVTGATVPSSSTKTLSSLTQIAVGNGYSDGGFQLSPNSTDFNALVEDDTNHWAYIALKNISWTASGGDIPASGDPASYLVLTTDEATVGNRQVIGYWSLLGDRTVLNGNPLLVTGLQMRIQGGGVIKGIQRGTISISNGNSSNTATISAVDPAKSVVHHMGGSTGNTTDSAADRWSMKLELTNATTVTASRASTTSNSPNPSVAYEVVEYF